MIKKLTAITLVLLVTIGVYVYKNFGSEKNSYTSNKYTTFSDSYFPLTFNYPSSWTRTTEGDKNANPVPTISETLQSPNGCKIYLGFGGGEGPEASEIKEEEITISGKQFNKKIWLKNGKPIFISYIEEQNIERFELMLISVPEAGFQQCVSEIEQIIETVNFL